MKFVVLSCCCPFMSVAELRAGALRAAWSSARRGLLQQFIEDFEVIYADDNLCTTWAELQAGASAVGRPLSAPDAWIAATALILNVPLATNNRRHFQSIKGLRLITLANPS
jgi:predicted nucleic acid-binding protein